MKEFDYPEIGKCCICGGTYKNGGCNPEPINNDVKARCCDYCNSAYVIPARAKSKTYIPVKEYWELMEEKKNEN